MTETVIIAPARMSADNPAWLRVKTASSSLQLLQGQDGSIHDPDAHEAATGYVAAIVESIEDLAPLFPHDAAYLAAVIADFRAWARGGFGIPDFLASLLSFQPQ